MESWTLHDVHDPQSPKPLRTRSACDASSSRYCFGAPCCAVSLRRVITLATPYFSLSSAAKRSSSLSALGLLLSSKPTTLPRKSVNRDKAAIFAFVVCAFPSGLRTIISCPPPTELILTIIERRSPCQTSVDNNA